jgi:uncharacterized protein YbaR (Trm112 family)
VETHSESGLMKLFRNLGLLRLAIASRRLQLPVPRQALVLDVGSGDSPFPRSDVLLDISLEDYERGGKLLRDRPLVIGIAERMPFKDQAFDFSVACHILEHSAHPHLFLKELQRVSKAGYIETPGELLELIAPQRCHRLLISQKGRDLAITKKSVWNPLPNVAALWSDLIQSKKSIGRFFRDHEMDMIIRYFWDGYISFEIMNPITDCSWHVPHPPQLVDRGKTRCLLREMTRFLVYRGARIYRKRAPSWKDILRCIECFSTDLEISKDEIRCTSCSRKYEVRQGSPIMLPTNFRWV